MVQRQELTRLQAQEAGKIDALAREILGQHTDHIKLSRIGQDIDDQGELLEIHETIFLSKIQADNLSQHPALISNPATYSLLASEVPNRGFIVTRISEDGDYPEVYIITNSVNGFINPYDGDHIALTDARYDDKFSQVRTRLQSALDKDANYTLLYELGSDDVDAIVLRVGETAISHLEFQRHIISSSKTDRQSVSATMHARNSRTTRVSQFTLFLNEGIVVHNRLDGEEITHEKVTLNALRSLYEALIRLKENNGQPIRPTSIRQAQTT